MPHVTGAPTSPPSTSPRQVLMTRATVADCARDYATAAHLRTTKEA